MATTLNDYREKPHWSFSAINQFINICNLQYAFQRVYKLAPAFTPFTLSFGSAFHRSLEWVYLTLKEGKQPVKKDSMDLFRDLWARQLAEDQNVRFDEDVTPDDCSQQGANMIGVLVDSLDPEEKVVQVNETFSVPLVDVNGKALQKNLIGEMDCILEVNHQVLIEDWKTSGRKWPKDKAGKDLQATFMLYAYRKINKSSVKFRYKVLVKNKTPVIETHLTERSEDDYIRLIELVKTVDAMVNAEHFLPNEQGFYCANCQFQTACKSWHNNRSKLISVAA